jgi:hypothetical protein
MFCTTSSTRDRAWTCCRRMIDLYIVKSPFLPGRGWDLFLRFESAVEVIGTFSGLDRSFSREYGTCKKIAGVLSRFFFPLRHSTSMGRTDGPVPTSRHLWHRLLNGFSACFLHGMRGSAIVCACRARVQSIELRSNRFRF